ncbi:hypothetical protein PPERSA_09966 [Pseudocohnilembus persalinus]|uniref:Uncharacterized protein n=1 Tax=Pseudocohnilembus persalinus TaxID=266149 RepID=A0A0V0QJB7_PSEPJ|nr:hypothetical protein PPERSA_09966 [Pseudocohnilembus persalinus]|eukprot:KRX02349.1 hypothetical protein PPERSA_09966 [Pseudocohnilembus persalinus]
MQPVDNIQAIIALRKKKISQQKSQTSLDIDKQNKTETQTQTLSQSNLDIQKLEDKTNNEQIKILQKEDQPKKIVRKLPQVKGPQIFSNLKENKKIIIQSQRELQNQQNDNQISLNLENQNKDSPKQILIQNDKKNKQNQQVQDNKLTNTQKRSITQISNNQQNLEQKDQNNKISKLDQITNQLKKLQEIKQEKKNIEKLDKYQEQNDDKKPNQISTFKQKNQPLQSNQSTINMNQICNQKFEQDNCQQGKHINAQEIQPDKNQSQICQISQQNYSQIKEKETGQILKQTVTQDLQNEKNEEKQIDQIQNQYQISIKNEGSNNEKISNQNPQKFQQKKKIMIGKIKIKAKTLDNKQNSSNIQNEPDNNQQNKQLQIQQKESIQLIDRRKIKEQFKQSKDQNREGQQKNGKKKS